MHTDLRLMYWPNEPAHLYPEFQQYGGRAGFEGLLADATIGALEIYSPRPERAKFKDGVSFETAAMERIRSFVPDIMFVQHMFGVDVSEAFWKRLREEMPNTTLVYHEADPFDRYIKRIDQPTRAVLRWCDLVLAVGLGSLADILAEPGRRPVEYLPHCFVKSRFAQRLPDRAEKTHDIVMIANRGRRKRLRFLYVPGGYRRARFARAITDMFGTRFALYGAGWDELRSSRGSLGFFEQEAAIQSGRITANWDHFDTIDYYFSDRLPISLAAGVPHVTSYHKGYEHIFSGCPGLYSCRTVEEAAETCRWLVSRPDRALREEGMAGREWIFANLEAVSVFRRGFEQSAAAHRRRLAMLT